MDGRLRISLLAGSICILAGCGAGGGAAPPPDVHVPPEPPRQNPPQERPLLGSSRARYFIDRFCEDQPDAAALPTDPRELIRPGVNAGRAVAFNAWWEDCTTPGANPRTKPQTCGEYRARVAEGEDLIRHRLVNETDGRGSITAERWNQLWQRWGLSARPADFDAQVRERYGLPKAPFPNPYPLEGEDPVADHGGSGELPLGIVQLRDADGRYNGTMAISCDVCHSGSLQMLGDDRAFLSGMGANTADFHLLMTDTSAPLPLPYNASRGVTNAMGLSGLLIGLLDVDSLGMRPDSALFMQIPGNTSGGGDTKMPAWWNASHRPRKFWDAGLSYNASRLDSAILNLTKPGQSPSGSDRAFNRALRDKIELESLAVQAYIDSLTSPVYPGSVNTALAEQGAILFHVKDLWASGKNDEIPRPPGNGSCASCHGAYSPRFVHDPAFLEDPRLEGIAGYVAPLEQIRTDPQRLRGFTPTLLELMSSSWFSYPEGSEGYVSPDTKDPFAERMDDWQVFTGNRIKGACQWQGEKPDDATGYLAPPLYGVWATAPYLHNASLPDVWAVLDPASRPAVWRRQLAPGAGAERGYDTRWDAYDEARLGWRHEVLTCGAGGMPYVSCEPEGAPAQGSTIVDLIAGMSGSLNSVSYQVTPPLTRQTIEERKIFNSHQFAKRNHGHDFTRALSDPERRALIEYLKTL